MESKISSLFLASSELKKTLASDSAFCTLIARAAREMHSRLSQGGTIYTCGNGGSACDAMHFAEELVARFKRERPGMRAMHFLDAGTLTCWSNDYEFESVFERQVKTFCTSKDVVVLISTSGNSQNIVTAAKAAKALGTLTIGLLGKSGGELKGLCDFPIVIPSSETERIQEAHITIIHVLCELLELDLKA